MVDLSEKQYLDKYDIMSIFDCCVNSAINIIRSIKHVNGGGALPKGKVLPSEYERWCNYPLEVQKYVGKD